MFVNNLCVKTVIFGLFVTFADAQECGTVSPNGKEVPWQAGIYSKQTRDGKPWPSEWRCGGSLISSKVVVTAAHYLAIYMKLKPENRIDPDSIEVVVGILSRPWKEPTNEDTQKSEVKNIHLAPGYKQHGIGAIPFFLDDIGVVIVVTAFRYNDNIRPVCLNFDYDFEQQHLIQGNEGKTAGWGKAIGDVFPAFVKQLYYVNLETCASEESTKDVYSNDRLFTIGISDKICMGAKDNNSAICFSDSGVGIAFPSTSKGIEQYYLRGVLSLPVNIDKICTTGSFYGFTSLRKHESFIRKYWNETEELPKKIGKCILPPYPEYGSYTVNVTHVPGGEEYVLVALTVSCEAGHGVKGNRLVSCYNGFWPDAMPTCVRMCRLDPHPSVDFRCLVSGSVVGDRACATNEPINTIANPRCREPDYYSPTNLPFMRCKEDGQWDYVARCLPECGRVTPDGKELVAGGVRARKGELPWHVGVYRTSTKPYEQICGGSLISKNLIVSAAHCFWNSIDKLLPASNFAAAVGKIYRPWDDPMDEAQKSEVKEIHIPSHYQGVDGSFQADIAVVVVATPFELKRFVRPVCLSFDPNFDRLQLQSSNKGKVAGWGLTGPNGKASPVLQVSQLPYVEIGTCIDESPPDFKAFITNDKICAGTQNSNSALCKGDSGGGLAFPATERDVERHYLRGVVSTAPSNNDACNTHTYTSFTQIFKHIIYVERHYLRGVVSTAPSNDACNTHTYTSFTQIYKHRDFIKPFLT